MKVTLFLDGRTAAGGTPLLMHNERLMDPLDSYTRALAKVTGKRKKTEADHLEIGRLEFMGGLYTTIPMEADEPVADGLRLSYPTQNVVRSIQAGATKQKLGRAVQRGVFPLEMFGDLTFDGDENIGDPDLLWKLGTFSLRKGVGVGQSKVMRTRGIFLDWTLTCHVEVDAAQVDLDQLEAALEQSGRYYGIGDYRPLHGRFTGSITEVAE